MLLAGWQGFIFSLSLCCDIGLVNLAIWKAGLDRGFRPAFLIGFGSCFGDLTYLILALCGMSVIFQWTPLRWAMWLAGTAMLLYLGVKMLRESVHSRKTIGPGQAADAAKPVRSAFWNGVALALSSPSGILWFAVMSGPIVAGLHGGFAAVIWFASGFFAAGMVWSLGMAGFGAWSGRTIGQKAGQALSFLSAVIFLLLSVQVFWNGWTTLAHG